MLSIQNIQIAYGKKIILQDSSIYLEPGYLTALMGLSGSGKSSLLNYLADCQTLKSPQYRIMYLKQQDNFFEDMNCLDNLRFQAKIYGKNVTIKQIKKAVEAVDLDIDLSLYPKALSGGEKQRLSLALALVCEANVILMDEVTASMDAKGREQIAILLRKIAKQRNCIILLASHDEALAQNCDRIYRIENQRLELIKDHLETSEKPLAKVSERKIGKLYSSYLKFRSKKHFIYQCIVSLVEGAAVSCLALGFVFFLYIQSETEAVLKLIPEGQVLATHQIPPSSSFQNEATFFDKEARETLYNLENTKVYPFYSWKVNFEQNSPFGSDAVYTIQLSVNDNAYQEMVFDNNINEYFGPEVYPYYPEQKYEELALISLESDLSEGIPCYISQEMARQLQLDMETLHSCSLRMIVKIPKAVEPFKMEIVTDLTNGDENADVYDALQMFYDTKEVLLQVQGIMDGRTANYVLTDEIYIPYDVMKVEMEKYSDSPFLEDGVLKISGAYMLFNDDVGRLNYELTQKVANIGLLSSRDDYRQRLNNLQESYKQTIRNLMIGALIVIAFSIIIFSFLYERSFKRDRILLKTRRQSNSKIRRFVIADILREGFFTIVSGSLMLVFLLYQATFYGYLSYYGKGFQWVGFVAIVGLSLIFSCLSHFVSLSKKS